DLPRQAARSGVEPRPASVGRGTVWRRHAVAQEPRRRRRGHRRARRVRRAPPGAPRRHVVFADGRAIRAWRPGGAVDAHAELPRKVVTIGLAGPAHLLAVLDDDSTWLVDLAR